MRKPTQIKKAINSSLCPSPIKVWIDHLHGWKAAFTWAILLTVLLRLMLGGMMAVTWSLTRGFLNPIIQTFPDLFGRTPLYKNFWFDIFIGVWVRWDGVNYIKIAQQGYAELQPAFSIFYPLYPALVRWTALLMANQFELASLVISTVCTLTALALLYKMVEDEYGPQPARWTVIALSIYPTAFFLVAPFTESLFLTLTLGVFYLARRDRWIWVGILGACASLARGPGIYTSAALAWLAWKQYRAGRLESLVSKAKVLTGLSLPVMSGTGFLIWRAWAGYQPLSFILIDHFRIELVDPISAIWFQLRQMVIFPWFTTWLDGVCVAAWMGLLVVMFKNSRWRRGEWLIYMGLNMVVFISKHNLIASPIQSITRYSLALFPGFIMVGEWLSRQGKRSKFIYIAANEILLSLSAVMNAMNIFIG
jgi:hypothetical protein